MKDKQEIVEFIDETLRDMTARPSFWGPLPSVELQVLRLLEVRLLLASADASIDDVADVASEYWKALDVDFPELGGRSLRARVDGDVARFSAWLSDFCARLQRAQDKPATRPRVTPLRDGPRPSAPKLQPWTTSHEYSSDRRVVPGTSRLPR